MLLAAGFGYREFIQASLRELERDLTEGVTENRKFSGEELTCLDFYFLLKARQQS